ncbi:YraN family protein [Konateibacter massiliensis]|uniref:YraN family protein n=1 Tax=Konateibacter massiliensis TaxID=2002841 RepID=UPI001F1B8FB0|nr:YraN family protein [Konateibacter massiliensis]
MNKRSIGEDYEKIAALYLKTEGYEILEQNFRCRRGEIDIIAKKDGYLRFVEVKYRSDERLGMPEEAVNYKKQHQISQTASYYLVRRGYSQETACCFDVVSILGNEIRLFKNAFEYCG